MNRTPLYDEHLALKGHMVDFAGWEMPIRYDSQIAEHHAVRRDAGMFDVSHMLPLDLTGEDARDYLRYLLANDVVRLTQSGKALYSCMLNPQGGVVDDLIVYYLTPAHYRIVVNAGCADTDLAWMRAQIGERDVRIEPRRDLAMVAIQGPKAIDKTLSCLPADVAAGAQGLGVFFAHDVGDWFVARTGYTGEDGFEVMLPARDATHFWRCLLSAGVTPCGLGARDTLRLEAGMNLYGQDMTDSVSPLDAGLKWTVALNPPERDFIGRAALEESLAAGENARFVGLLLEGKGVLRNHLPLYDGERLVGEITSGGFSPTLERSIALARIQPGTGPLERCEVELRGKRLPVRVVRTTFVRQGKSVLEP